MTDFSRQPVYVVGAAETPLGEVWDHSELSMVAVAAKDALGQAGMTLKDVDAVFVNYMGEEGSIQVAEYLGIRPRYADSSDLGGGSFEAFVHHAMCAIAAGRCEVALIAFASRQRSKRGRKNVIQAATDSLPAQFEVPYGLPMPIGQYALIAARHMHEFGTKPEHLAAVAVTAREWARMNPAAWSREPLTIDDVLQSRLISDPLHKLDCCLVTDGGGVIIVTSQARARDAAKRPIRVLGAGESTSHWNIAQMTDLTVSPGKVAAREAFAMAGITPNDVDVLQPYDAFTICVILHLEDLGFCPKGEGGPFVASGALRPGGSIPSMTSGGGLSHNHPGALGIQLLVETVRQLRGESGERQVPNATIGVAHGMGGLFSACATVILARE